MDNTSIAAITLPNGNRHVYFQENTGALRRAIFSSQAGVWRVSDDVAQIASRPENNTPLAVVRSLEEYDAGDENVSTLT